MVGMLKKRKYLQETKGEKIKGNATKTFVKKPKEEVNTLKV
jgi:hypothetical protein